MMVLIVERVPAGLRGELSRWLLEPKAGVFVGRVSAMVRDRLWERACKGAAGGAVMLIWRVKNEQGFDFRLWGDASRTITDWEGLKLVTLARDRYPNRKGKGKAARAATPAGGEKGAGPADGAAGSGSEGMEETGIEGDPESLEDEFQF